MYDGIIFPSISITDVYQNPKYALVKANNYVVTRQHKRQE